MEQTNRYTHLILKISVLVLLVAVIVLGTVTFKALERKNVVESAVTTLCGEALTDITLNLRQSDPLAPEYFYRLHEITRVYPDTNYAVLADMLLSLTDDTLREALSPSDREAMASCIEKTNDPTILNDDLLPLIDEIASILAPYLYR